MKQILVILAVLVAVLLITLAIIVRLEPRPGRNAPDPSPSANHAPERGIVTPPLHS